MEKHSFIAELKADVEFSDSDFEFLFKSSRTHYDSTVQSISAVGGFLYGLKTAGTFQKEKINLQNLDLEIYNY